LLLILVVWCTLCHMDRKDILRVYEQGPDAVVELVENLIEAFTSKIVELTHRIEELERQLNKDSHNSGKPPSSDGLRKKKRTKSSRKRSGKKSGGQKGHKGKTLEMSENPDRIERLKLKKCTHCGSSLEDSSVKAYEKRQVFDIPKIEITVTEYQAEIKDCRYCHKESRSDFPELVTHKTQYGNYLRSLAVYFRNYELIPLERTAEIFEDIFSVPLCEGTIVNTTKRCAKNLNNFKDWVVEKLKTSSVVHFDETGVNINAKLHWLHNASTPFLTSYCVHEKRGSIACDEIGILPCFEGTAIHDHWQSYFKYECNHGLCNAHHIRELTFVHEEEGQQWAKKMIEFLCEVKGEVEKVKEKGKLLDTVLMKRYVRKYKMILKEGFNINPPPQSEKVKKRGRKKKSKTLNLLERLRDYWRETLAFMYDLNIPFDNNLAERDIRMVKVQQKISGLFRTKDGAEQFCLIRSFISTVKKQRINVIDAIHSVLEGKQIYQDFCC